MGPPNADQFIQQISGVPTGNHYRIIDHYLDDRGSRQQIDSEIVGRQINQADARTTIESQVVTGIEQQFQTAGVPDLNDLAVIDGGFSLERPGGAIATDALG